MKLYAVTEELLVRVEYLGEADDCCDPERYNAPLHRLGLWKTIDGALKKAKQLNKNSVNDRYAVVAMIVHK